MSTEHEVGIIEQVVDGRLNGRQAAEALGVSVRTVWRKLKKYRARGAEGLVHGLTGRPSNRAKPGHLKAMVAELYQQGHQGLSLNEFTQVVVEGKGVELSRETIRKWLIDAGMWVERKGSE